MNNPKISKAPRPIRPIGSSPLKLPRFDTHVKGPADWGHWRHVTTIEIWQGLLLSFNIDPPGAGWLLENAPGKTGDIPYDYLNSHRLTEEFNRRWCLVRNRLETYYAAMGASRNAELTNFLRLSLFAAWAVEYEWKNLPHELVALAKAPDQQPEAAAPQKVGAGRMAPEEIEASTPRACSEFLAMSKLSASEVFIEFAAGESGGVVLNVSARKVKRRVALPDLDLFDHRKGEMNIRGNVMLRWAMGDRVTPNRKGMTKQIERLRKELKSRLGIIDNPIMHTDGVGYEPVFNIADKRGAADKRAKREAEGRTVSIEELQGRGVQFGGGGLTDYSYETDEEMAGDAADKFLKNRR